MRKNQLEGTTKPSADLQSGLVYAEEHIGETAEMTREILLYSGSAVIVLWGIAHIAIPTKSIVEGFGPISQDNRRILLMEWIMEGLALCFIGLLVILLTFLRGAENPVAAIVYRASSVMLVVMAGVSLFTGARTSIIPMKLCPPIFITVAVLYWLATLL